MPVDYNILKNVASVGDFQRLQEEFDLKKRQQAQAQQLGDLQALKLQREIETPDLEGLAQQSLYAYHQGQPLTPEGKAAIETLATLKGSNVQYKPDEFGNVRAVTEPNSYQVFLGGAGASRPNTMDPFAVSQAAIKDRQQQIGSNPYQSEIEPVPLDLAGIEAQLGANSPALNMPVKGENKSANIVDIAFSPEYAPNLDQEVLTSPYGRKALFEQQLKLMQDMKNPSTEIGKMQLDEKRGLVPVGSTDALIKEKTRQTRKEDMELEATEKAAREAEEQEKATKTVAEKKVKEALAILNKSYSASGFPATAALTLPGKAMPPDVLNSAYSTLKSAISLDAMTKLKQASSTGSTGFGALSQNELKILTDKIGELDAELPYNTQMENIRTIAEILKLDIPELTGAAASGDVQNLIDRYAD